MSTSNAPDGITTAGRDETLGRFILPDPMTAHTYFEDFDYFRILDWEDTIVANGSGSATQVLANEDGGVLLITNRDALADSTAFFKFGESFQFEVGKQIWFKSRLNFSNSLSSWIMGLQIKDVVPIASLHGVWLSSAKGTNDIVLNVKKNLVGSSTLTLTSEDFSGEFFTLGFHYDGDNEITGYINDIALGTLPADNIPDTEILTIQFFMENATANADTMSIDNIFAAKER